MVDLPGLFLPDLIQAQVGSQTQVTAFDKNEVESPLN
jgi:hypothetical protein